MILSLAVFFLLTADFGVSEGRPESIGDDVIVAGHDLQHGDLEAAVFRSLDGQEVVLLPASETSGRYTSDVFKADYPFNALGLHWVEDVPQGRSVEAEIRFSPDGENWSDWQQVEKSVDGVPDHIDETKSAGESIGELCFYEQARYFQYRFQLTAPLTGERPVIRKVTASYIDAKGYHNSRFSLGAIWSRISSMVEPQTASAQPRIFSRAEWGADESLMTWDPQYQEPRKQIIHHTVTSNYDTNPAATIRSIYYYHAVSLGWGDIGYNYLIDQYGNIYEGRYGGNGVIGGHALTWNYGSIGIAVLGDYSSVGVSPQAYNGLVALMTWNSNVNKIDPLGNDYLNGTYSPNYLGHRDVGLTACPGNYLYQVIPSIRSAAYSRYIIPRGSLDYAYVDGPMRVSAGGWAIDSNTTDPIGVHVYIDGQWGGSVSANGSRPDVGEVFPPFGANHGYSLNIDGIPPGSHNVCAYGINAGAGSNALLGCRTVDVLTHPFGNLDGTYVSGPGQIEVSGWAIDPDTMDSIDVHVYVDGTPRGTATADGDRIDVEAVYPGFGAGHGYNLNVASISPGSHSVCAYGINIQGGGNALLGCRSVYVPVNPFGFLDDVSVSAPHQINLKGWAIDPDTMDSIDVHVYVDGTPRGTATADGDRIDVEAVYPGFGAGHGYNLNVASISPGSHSVCAYGINIQSGGNALLGCRSVYVPIHPFGSLDGVLSGSNGKVNVSGWAIDPDGVDVIDVHVYINGQLREAITADDSRADIGAVFPGYGPGHGFSGQVDAVATSNTVCAYGINVGPGGNALLGCKSVNVQVNPFGNLDSITDVGSGQIEVSGWAIDPNAGTGPIDVHFYVNGVYKGPLTADQNRPDIAAAYPAYGGDHSFNGTVAAQNPGANNTVCAYGINVGPGGNALLGCRTVEIPGGN